MFDSFRISLRAVSGFVRTSDEIDARVLNRKCGLIWFVRASIRALISSFSCSRTRCSMRASFQILIGAVMQRIVPRYTTTAWNGFRGSSA